jgi:hypothetical protein
VIAVVVSRRTDSIVAVPPAIVIAVGFIKTHAIADGGIVISVAGIVTTCGHTSAEKGE